MNFAFRFNLGVCRDDARPDEAQAQVQVQVPVAEVAARPETLRLCFLLLAVVVVLVVGLVAKALLPCILVIISTSMLSLNSQLPRFRLRQQLSWEWRSSPLLFSLYP